MITADLPAGNLTGHPHQAHWVLNFILHPVFAAELAIWAAALFTCRQHAKARI